MNKKLLFRLAALLAAMMCALGANAAEAYACVSYDTLTFYYDDQRNSHSTATFDVNAEGYYPGWLQMAGVVKYVVFDPSFAAARPTSTRFWFAGMDLESITGLSYLNTSEVVNMAYMFSSCFNLTSLDLSSFNTSKVTNMEGMFDNCANLINLDLSSFNISQVTNMEYMFHDCRALTSLDLSSFNTSQVTNMEYMFADCYVLTSLDLSSFNTSQVTNMRYMFDTCWKLASVDLSSFNTPQVTNMEGMFAACWALASLDLSSFNTSQVTNMESMFAACTSLTSLDLSSFNTSQVTNMESMFEDCTSLHSVCVDSGWTTASVIYSDDMFRHCTILVGGKGTPFDGRYVDKTYAHIDGGPSNPGYFTEKPAFLRGDVNGDGSVNISDVTALIDYLLTGNASGISLSGADTNQDNSINISDVTALIDYLLAGNWPSKVMRTSTGVNAVGGPHFVDSENIVLEKPQRKRH